MLTQFRPQGSVLERAEVRSASELEPDARWIDLLAPSEEERSWVEATFGKWLPTPEDLEEIEASSRHIQDADGTYLQSYFLAETFPRARLTTVGLLFDGTRLLTFRTEELATFRSVGKEATRTPGLAEDDVEIVLRLFETEVDRVADLIERLHAEIDRIASETEHSEKMLDALFDEIATLRGSNDKIRLLLIDTERALSFLLRRQLCPAQCEPVLREIIRDVDSLSAHSGFLFERLDAVMRETLGRINIVQNRIIKIFSVAAVVLLPPTFVASLYGMNFRFMPELYWELGYPLALLLMVVSALVPFWYFKRRGWL